MGEQAHTRHQPVLLDEIKLMLEPALSRTDTPALLDCTLGGGGHSEALLAEHANLFLCGIDRDPAALKRSKERLAPFAKRLHLAEGNLGQLDALASNLPEAVRGKCCNLDTGSLEFHAILLDLGLSSDQLDDAERGFAFSQAGPLDMRMNPANQLTASEVLNNYSPAKLEGMFRRGGVGSSSRFLARAIAAERPLHRTEELREICVAVARRASRKKTARSASASHPATVPFQALRIEVNDELGALRAFFEHSWRYLAPGGRMAVISFHSLEDRIAAQSMRRWSRPAVEERRLPQVRSSVLGTLLTKKAIVPSEEECRRNPRSRSARLRVFEIGLDDRRSKRA